MSDDWNDFLDKLEQRLDLESEIEPNDIVAPMEFIDWLFAHKGGDNQEFFSTEKIKPEWIMEYLNDGIRNQLDELIEDVRFLVFDLNINEDAELSDLEGEVKFNHERFTNLATTIVKKIVSLEPTTFDEGLENTIYCYLIDFVDQKPLHQSMYTAKGNFTLPTNLVNEIIEIHIAGEKSPLNINNIEDTLDEYSDVAIEADLELLFSGFFLSLIGIWNFFAEDDDENDSPDEGGDLIPDF